MRLFLLLVSLIGITYAQMPSFSIKGSVKDQKTKAVMEYCTVSLFQNSDQSLVTGMVSDFNGNFTLDNLKPGKYYLEVSFIGFEAKIIEDIILNKENPSYDAGVVYLGSDATIVNEVEITALKSSVRYKLDKKIVDVDKNIAASNGTAADVLATVPSVTTDIDGEISLRGSKGFRVLINGRPSVLDANDALQQIPANTIQNIEIITNPSAKYDADGTAGIINIITKKNSLEGFTGIINVRGGTFHNYGGDATLSYKVKKFTFTVSGNYSRRGHPGNYYSELNTTLNDTLVSTINDGNKNRQFTRYNFKANIEYAPAENQYVNFQYRLGAFGMKVDDVLDYTFANRTTGEEIKFTNINDTYRKFPYHEFAVNYGYDFENKSKITAHVSYNFRNSDEVVVNDRFNNLDEIILGTRSTEGGDSYRFRFNADYEYPIQEHSKFELGVMQQFAASDEINRGYGKNLISGGYDAQDQFSSDVLYKTSIRAFYGIFSSKWDKVSYQVGLRTENTQRNILVKNNGNEFNINRLDLFPSVHLSYNINENHQYFVSYSKRINRPRGWYLEPNTIYTDANTLWSGNPDILPEYIHVVETGWLFNFKKKGSLNNEFYFRREENVINFVRIPIGLELTQQFPENVGVAHSAGLESSLSLLPTKWWNTDLMANLFYYNLKGSFENEVFDRSSFSYILRWNNYFKIAKSTKIQFNGAYTSPIANALGETKFTISFDAGVKQDLFKKKLSLGIQVRDLFNTYVSESTSNGSNFDFYRRNDPRGPSVVFSASYKINNYKPAKPSFSEGGSGGGF